MYDRFSGFNFKLVSPRRVKKIIEHCALYFVASMNKKKKIDEKYPFTRCIVKLFQDKIPDKRSRESNWKKSKSSLNEVSTIPRF